MSGIEKRPQSTGDRFAEELMAADRNFAAEVAAAPPSRRGEVWSGWFAEEGCQVIPGRVVQGSDSILSLMGPAFANPGYSLSWEPDLARSSLDGTLGLTSGRYSSTTLEAGQMVVRKGRYVSVWKRVEGRWRVSLDTGVPD